MTESLVGLDDRLTRSGSVVGVPVDGETVLVDEAGFRLHHLDRLATAVWEQLDVGRSVREAATALAELFDAAPPQLVRDVQRLATRLVADGVLVRSPQP